MPNGRPYEASILEQTTQHMINNGSGAINAPRDPEPIEANTIEAYPGRMESAFLAIRGIARFATLEGREQIARERAEVHRKRLEVGEFVGRKIGHVDRTVRHESLSDSIRWVGGADPNSKKLVAWTGTHKRKNPGSKARTRSFNPNGNIGKQLLDTDRLVSGEDSINELRPTTYAEQRVSNRLEARIEKARTLRRNARWEVQSKSLEGGSGERLSRKEKRTFNKVAKRVQRLERKAELNEARFYTIATGQDLGGNVRRRLQDRAVRKANSRREKIRVRDEIKARKQRERARNAS